MQHQAAVAERNRQRAVAGAVREHNRAVREAERAYAAAQRAQVQAVRATERERAAAEKEAKRLHVEAQESQVQSLNADLQMKLEEIDSILKATLEVDDFVDLGALRQVAEHPPFESTHQNPVPQPGAIQAPPEPQWQEPAPPKGLFGKKKHAEAVAQARQKFERDHADWARESAQVPMQQLEALTRHKLAEEARLKSLAEDQAKYDAGCRERHAETEKNNAALQELVTGLTRRRKEAVEEYIGIVFGNSVYPESMPWDVEFEYSEQDKELRVDLYFPRPEDLPTAKQYKYVKSSDTIAETAQTQKEQKDRYASVVHNMTLRTLHEVWESDRGGAVDTISLAGGVKHVNPATGHETFTPLIAIAVARADVVDLDLSRVTPAETLKHLGAVVSKNPHALDGIDTTQGVRGH